MTYQTLWLDLAHHTPPHWLHTRRPLSRRISFWCLRVTDTPGFNEKNAHPHFAYGYHTATGSALPITKRLQRHACLAVNLAAKHTHIVYSYEHSQAFSGSVFSTFSSCWTVMSYLPGHFGSQLHTCGAP